MRDKGCHFNSVRIFNNMFSERGQNNSGENKGVCHPVGGWAWAWAWTLQTIDVALGWTSSTWITGLTGT